MCRATSKRTRGVEKTAVAISPKFAGSSSCPGYRGGTRSPLGLKRKDARRAGPKAKLKSGISSDSKLLEAALANLAVADDYAQWLLAQRGTINPELDLEF
jgi:hypothetical protein